MSGEEGGHLKVVDDGLTGGVGAAGSGSGPEECRAESRH